MIRIFWSNAKQSVTFMNQLGKGPSRSNAQGCAFFRPYAYWAGENFARACSIF